MRKPYLRRVASLSLSGVLLCAAISSTAAFSAEWRTYNLSSRRVQEIVTALAPAGSVLWVGYANGRMDKYEIKTDRWTHNALPAGYARSRINDIKSIDRRLYLATDTGLCVFDLFVERFIEGPEQENLKGYPILDIESTDRYLFMAIAHDNPFGVDTPGGLIRYDRGFHTWKLYAAEQGLGSNKLNDIEVKDGVVWLATERGLMKFEPEVERLTRASYERAFRDEDIRKLKFAGGKLWCGGRGKIWEFDPATGGIREFKLGDEYDYAVTNIFSLDNLVLIGTEEHGMIGYDAGREVFFEIENKDVSTGISAMEFYQDAVWISSHFGRVRDSLVSFDVSAARKKGKIDMDGLFSKEAIPEIAAGEMRDTPFQQLVENKHRTEDAFGLLEKIVGVLAEGKPGEVGNLFVDDFPGLAGLVGRFKAMSADPSKKAVVTKADVSNVKIAPTSAGHDLSAPEGQTLFKIVFQRKEKSMPGVTLGEELTISPAFLELRGDKIVRWE